MSPPPCSANRRQAGAFATVVVLALIAIMCLLIAVNASSARRAYREIRLVRDKQLSHQPWLITNVTEKAVTSQ